MKHLETLSLIDNFQNYINADHHQIAPLIRVLHRELQSNQYLSIVGASIVAISDNAVYGVLNSNSATYIGEKLGLSEDQTRSLQMLLLLNGFIAITAMDLYTSRGLFTDVISLWRQRSIMPAYKKRFSTVAGIAALLSLIGVSGGASLVYNLYKETPFIAFSLALITVMINLFILEFFTISLFDSFWNFKNTHLQAKISEIKLVLSSFQNSLIAQSTTEHEQVIAKLKHFYQLNQPSHTDMEDILSTIRPLFTCNAVSSQSTNRQITSNRVQYLENSVSCYVGSGAALLFLFVGKGAVNQILGLQNNFISVGLFPGLCMGLMSSIAAYYSTHQLLKQIRSVSLPETTSTTRASLAVAGKSARAIGIIFVGILYSLSMVELVHQYGPKNTLMSGYLVFAACLQAFTIIANSLTQMTSTPSLVNAATTTHGFFKCSPQQKQRNAAEKIDNLIRRIELLPESDLESISQALSNNQLLQPV